MLCCGNCGAPIVVGGAFCDKCGGRIDDGRVLQTPLEYAGFWRRVAASMIDGVLMFVVKLIVSTVLILGFHAMKRSGDQISSDASMVVFAADYGVGLVINWLYFALMESSAKQATVGKLALGIQVTDVDHNRISFARASGRYFSKIASAIILMIGFMMAGFTQKKQALHDMMASTLVVVK